MLNPIDRNLWTLRYPLKVLGTDHGRTVSVIRLACGRLVIHSMAPFTAGDVAAIRELGEPGWLIEAMLLHDTYSAQGRAAFPGPPFLAPAGFGRVVDFPVSELGEGPVEWGDELECYRLEGAPRLEEHACFHRPTRTLIIADLLFNFPPDESGWNRFFHRHVAGIRSYPGTSRIFRAFIRDRPAFKTSLEQVMDWDFDRIIPGHGEIIETGGKAVLRTIADRL